MARLSSRVYVALGAVALLAYLFLPRTLSTVVYDAAGLASAAAIGWLVTRGGLPRAHRRPWLTFAGAALLWTTGDVVGSIQERGAAAPPFPSVADGLYLAGYLLLLVAGVLAVIQRGTSDHKGGRLASLDATMVVAAAAVPVWVLCLAPSLHSTEAGSAAQFFALAYPAIDLLLIGAVVRGLFGAGRWSRAGALLGAGIALTAVSDIVYNALVLAGVYHTPSPVDLGWIGASLLWGLAAIDTSAPQFLDRGRRHTEGAQSARAWVVFGAVLLPLSVVVFSYITERALNPLVVLGPVAFIATAMVVRLRLVARSGATDWSAPALLATAGVTIVAVAVGLTQLHATVARKERAASALTEVLTRAEVLDGVAARTISLDPDESGPALDEWGSAVAEVRAAIQNVGPVAGNAQRDELAELMRRYIAIVSIQVGEIQRGGLTPSSRSLQARAAHSAFVDNARGAAEFDHASAEITARQGRIGSVVALCLAVVLLGLVFVRYGGVGRKAQLAHQAFHDTLTGLPNRGLVEHRARQAFARSTRSLDVQALVLLDLDDFKAVNDSLGHPAGDELIRQVAGRLIAGLRSGDTLARIGGDEFAVLLEDCESPAAARLVADRVLTALGEPVVLGDHRHTVQASIGIAVSDGSGPGTPEDQAAMLFRNAELAMYEAKRHDGTWIEAFTADMHDAVSRRLELKAELELALEREEFSLVYQPIVDIAARRITGYEALVRWIHPERGFTSPADFIPVAEQTGLIVELGTWVLREACRQMAVWRSGWAPGDERYVSVNVAGHQLQRINFADQVEAALTDSGLPPEALLLEVTESSLIRDVEGSERRMESVRALGVRFAIDDFGTGYSSLSYLHRFPVDVLKIDKSFIDHVAGEDRGRALVDAIVNMAGSLDLAVVAEGIEETEQVEALAGLRCGLGQGYHYSRPLPAADVATFSLPPGPIPAAAAGLRLLG